MPLRCGLALLLVAFASATSDSAAQVPISPGPLAKAHAALDGVGNCTRCHEAGRELSPARCLGCHKPIAARIANKTGVHRAVTGECQACHVEHAGVGTDLRGFDTRTFNHAVETGFPIEGQHAKLAATCASCHKKRTFLDQRAACSSCHKDVHKATVGNDCTKCHSVAVPFKDARKQFDHVRAKFQLTGAHRTVGCEKCHVSGVLRGLHFDACSSCHKPHRNTLGPVCTQCHTTERWTNRTVEHGKTGFQLAGAHARAACEKCHVSSITKPLVFDRCSSCHANPHRESAKEDCRKCHTEASFKGATFDHGVRTRFPLVEKHQGLACRKCHTTIAADDVPLARKVVDFGGTSAACVSCHKDQHKGEYGRTCEACHAPATFKAAGFVHPRSPEFFAGRHAGVACVKCHVRGPDAQTVRTVSAPPPARYKAPAMACATCHADIHLGQLRTACEKCHVIDAPKFAAAGFAHDRTPFPLTGKHKAAECVKCHPSETRVFPAGTGTARRFSPMSGDCQTCHKDAHLGQTDSRCQTCHTAVSFRILAYPHAGLESFLTGFHGALACRSCHKTETGQFPAGQGTAIRFKVGRTCRSCHPQFFEGGLR
jgi:hypothetical protein